MLLLVGCCICDGTLDGECTAFNILCDLCLEHHLAPTAPEYRHILEDCDSHGRTLNEIMFPTRTSVYSRDRWASVDNPYVRLLLATLENSVFPS